LFLSAFHSAERDNALYAMRTKLLDSFKLSFNEKNIEFTNDNLNTDSESTKPKSPKEKKLKKI